MNKAIMIDVTCQGLESLESWDLGAIRRLVKIYGADAVRPLRLVDFETGIEFKVYENMKGDVVILQKERRKNEQNTSKDD